MTQSLVTRITVWNYIACFLKGNHDPKRRFVSTVCTRSCGTPVCHTIVYTQWSRKFIRSCTLSGPGSSYDRVHTVVQEVHTIVYTQWSRKFIRSCTLSGPGSSYDRVHSVVQEVHTIVYTQWSRKFIRSCTHSGHRIHDRVHTVEVHTIVYTQSKSTRSCTHSGSPHDRYHST